MCQRCGEPIKFEVLLAGCIEEELDISVSPLGPVLSSSIERS